MPPISDPYLADRILGRAMEGSQDESGAPDSWELADLDEAMSRLLASSSSSSKKTPPPVLVDDVADSAVLASAPVAPSDSSSSQAAAVEQVDQFLREALEKPRERLAILRMEQDIEKFISDPTQQELELQPLPNSYLRLAAHRIALHYSLQSIAISDNISSDSSNSRIFLRKIPSSRLPSIRLADIPVSLQNDESSSMVKVAIKQRPQKHAQNARFSGTRSSSREKQSKSVEERKEEYNRARARIFNSSDSIADGDYVTDSSFRRSPVEKPASEPTGDINVNQGSSRSRSETEVPISRYRVGGRVAIFRDRELDRNDPDYNRNYDRYVQRFDPGFGFNGGGAYSIQPLYAPAVNYNTEFPQLGSSHMAQISMEHQRRPVSRHPHGPWLAAGSPYGTPEGLMSPPFSPNPANPYVYLPPSPQYLSQPRANPRPGMGFIHHQSQQRQPEANYGPPRPQ